MTPNENVLNPKIPNDFSLMIDGQVCIAYQFKLFDMQNNLISDISTERINLEVPLYNGEFLKKTIEENQLNAGNSYKWQVELYACDITVTSVDVTNKTIIAPNHNLFTGDTVFISSADTLPAPLKPYCMYYIRKIDHNTIALFEYLEGAKNDAGRINITSVGVGEMIVSNVVSSEQIPFSVYDVPSITLQEQVILSQSFTFTPTYIHPQGVMVNSFEVLTSVNGADIVSSGTIQSSKLCYTIDGLMNGYTLYVKFKVTTNVGQVCYSEFTEFPIEYATPDLGIIPLATNQENKAAIQIDWPDIIQINGEITGNYEFVEDYIFKDNTGLQLSPRSSLTFKHLNVYTENALPLFWWSPLSADFAGDFLKAENSESDDEYCIGYNGINFYHRINGIVFNNLPMKIYPSILYLIGVSGNDLIVNPVTNI